MSLLRAFPFASMSSRPARWRPGLPASVRHSDIFAPGGEASGAGAALALALDQAGPEDAERPWLWVQDKAARQLGGRPYRPGLPAGLRHRLIHVAADGPEDALFALEEGLRCRELAFVIGEIAGNPKALNFTASRRLGLAAERHGTPLWLVRLGAARDLGSARMRWEVGAAPSPPTRWNAYAPGIPSWRAELFRAHVYQPGEWRLEDRDGILAAHSPLPVRGEDTKAWQHGCLAEVGEGDSTGERAHPPLQAALALGRASFAILSPNGERAGVARR